MNNRSFLFYSKSGHREKWSVYLEKFGNVYQKKGLISLLSAQGAIYIIGAEEEKLSSLYLFLLFRLRGQKVNFVFIATRILFSADRRCRNLVDFLAGCLKIFGLGIFFVGSKRFSMDLNNIHLFPDLDFLIFFRQQRWVSSFPDIQIDPGQQVFGNRYSVVFFGRFAEEKGALSFSKFVEGRDDLGFSLVGYSDQKCRSLRQRIRCRLDYDIDRRVNDDEWSRFASLADFAWVEYLASYDQSSGVFFTSIAFGAIPIVRLGSIIHSMAIYLGIPFAYRDDDKLFFVRGLNVDSQKLLIEKLFREDVCQLEAIFDVFG